MDFDYTIEKLQQEIDDCDSGDEEGWKQRMLKEKMAAIKKANNEMREKLMEQVDEIILRQNISEPFKQVETFQIETASRRVLKDLTATYIDNQGKQNEKIKELIKMVEGQKEKQTNMEGIMKKIQYMVTDTLQFATDIAVTKGKMEDLKAVNEKRNEQTKEYINSIKEVLETRVDSIMQFEDRLENLNMEINKCKRTHDDFADRIID